MKTRRIEKINLLSATPGVETYLTVVRYGGHSEDRSGAQTNTQENTQDNRQRPPKVYLQAGLHADEWPGILALNHLQILLDAADAKGNIVGEIVLLPYANPMGMAQFLKGYHIGRFDFDMTGNFNRDYVDLANWAVDEVSHQLTENKLDNQQRIRKVFADKLNAYQPSLAIDYLKKQLLLLSFDSDYVLDLHCDTKSILHLYCNQRQQTQGELLAACLDCDLVLLEDDPGCIGFDIAGAGAWWKLSDLLKQRGIESPVGMPCFSSTVELRGQGDVDDVINAQDAANLYRYLVQIGVVQDEDVGLIAAQTASVPAQSISKLLTAVDTIIAPSAGLVVYKKALGEAVKAGDVVAELIDITQPPSASPRIPLVANTDGIVFTQITNNLVRPGHTVVKIVGDTPLTYRQGNLLAF